VRVIGVAEDALVAHFAIGSAEGPLVVGSTDLSQRLSPEDADEVRREHFSILRRAIAEYHLSVGHVIHS